jgi:hypothetical protein
MSHPGTVLTVPEVILFGCYIARISCYTSDAITDDEPEHEPPCVIVKTLLRLASITASASILTVATVARLPGEASYLFWVEMRHIAAFRVPLSRLRPTAG